MINLARGLAALVLLGLAAGALAFVRSTTDQTQDPCPPLGLSWRPRQIAFQVNATAFTGLGCSGSAAAAAAVRASFPAWENAANPGQAACTDFKFTDGSDTTRTDLGFDANNRANNVNLVVFRKGNCSAVNDSLCHPADPNELGPCIEKYNCWEDADSNHSAQAIALTTVQFVQSTGEILDADMELNGWNGSMSAPTGMYFTCASPGSGVCAHSFGDSDCIEFDVQNTVTHEAGHMLGFDHVCVSSGTPGVGDCPAGGSVMAPTAARGDTDKRTLKPDDVSAVCTIYPAGASTAAPSDAVLSTRACPTRSSGCSTGGVGAVSLVGLGLLALRRLRGSLR